MMASPAAVGKVHIDIVSDTVCPWCWVGKRNLDTALASLPPAQKDAVTLRWRPFLLVAPRDWESWGPEALTAGVDKRAYYDKRFGKDAWKAFMPRLESAMQGAGISGFTMDGRTGPSADSHRLLAWAAETKGQAAQHALAETLFESYFARGEPLCRHDVLAAAAERAGLPRAEAEALLASSSGVKELEDELQLGRALGVTGVPFFRVTDAASGRSVTVSGAQPPEALAEAVRRVMPVAAGAVCLPGGECL